MKFLIALFALLAPATAFANQVALDSEVFVERNVEQADGTVTVTLVEPSRVVPGDGLVFVLSYRNTSAEPADNFTVTNPLPDAVAFRDTPDTGAVFSVDGGTTFGPLSDLAVTGEDGTQRPARAEDVTHIRWTLTEPIPAGGTGQLTFRGVVR
jgi:uncharacterized repeat protein (TIGR01451 family)